MQRDLCLIDVKISVSQKILPQQENHLEKISNSVHLDLYCTSQVSNVCVTLIAVPRNYDPVLHPFEVPREYTRALNATKLERVFAKPFLSSLDGHRDGVNCMAKHPKSLSTVLSGACDGEVSCSYKPQQKRSLFLLCALVTFLLCFCSAMILYSVQM